MARHSIDGHLPSLLFVAALQSKREEGSVGGPEEGPALCLRLGAAASSSLLKGPTAAAKARRPGCWPSVCAARDGRCWKAWNQAARPSASRSGAFYSIQPTRNSLLSRSCC